MRKMNDDVMEDPLALYEAVVKANGNTKAANARHLRLTREIFTGKAGREWLVTAMARANFMGSVFASEDGMSATRAAYQDGIRSVFSEILNAVAAGRPAGDGEDD